MKRFMNEQTEYVTVTNLSLDTSGGDPGSNQSRGTWNGVIYFVVFNDYVDMVEDVEVVSV